jgi:RNA-directed DNA polymerase
MKVLYIEGVATHSGPESCVAGREGGGEALTGESAGRAIEPIMAIEVPTPSSWSEGNITGRRREGHQTTQVGTVTLRDLT